jgi:hypothetical protein
MSINLQQSSSQLFMDEPCKNTNKLFFLSKITKSSKSPDIIKSSKSKAQFELTNFHNIQSSQISLNKSNMSVQKIFFNKKNYEQYMFQKNYLISKTQYNKVISCISDIEIKLKENNDLIDKYNNDLNNLKQTKKKKQEEIVELLSNKESLEEIYQNKVSNFKINGSIRDKNEIINGQNINNENVNENGEEHTNPNTNDSNNSNEENKNAENENDTHKKKESSTSSTTGSLSTENNNIIEIKLNDIKISNQKKYEEQINSFIDEIIPKNDDEFSLKLKKKVNLSYQAFFAETNSLDNDAQISIANFFLRISEFISTQNVGIINEKTANLFIRELMKINSIDEEISEMLKFLNKEYKDNKKDLKEKIKILNEKNDHLIIKKKTYETKKDDLKMFMEENKEKYNIEKNKINNEDDTKIQNVSFISEGNNNNNNHIMLGGCRSGFKKNSVKIKKINFDSLNNSKNKLFCSDNNESNDLNISRDMAPNSDRQIIDNLNKYLINSLQINSKSRNKEKSIEKGNKKIVLHKNSYKNINGLNVNNLINNNNNEESNPQINESKNNLVNNSEAFGELQNTINKKRINMKIVYRNSKLNNPGKKTNSVVMYNSSNLQDLLSAQKKPNTSKIIFLKDSKSNSFKNINVLKSPPKITKTHRHNHIYFQREELKAELFSRSPDGNNNYRYITKTNGIPYQGKIIPLSKGNLDTKRIDISKIDKSNIYSTRYDNRLKMLTQGIKESFCYFKFYKENHVEYNPIDELLKTPENLDYVEGYISIDVFLHKFKLIPKIYKNKKITYEQLVQNLSKEINIIELDSCNDYDYCDYHKDFLGIELKDIIDVDLSKEMKEVIKIYNAYIKYAERQDKPDLNKFLNTREIRDILLDQNDKIKAVSCKYFIFSLKFKKESSPKIEFIFINYEQFNLWYNCLQYIIKINNQTPKLINLKTYGSPIIKKI